MSVAEYACVRLGCDGAPNMHQFVCPACKQHFQIPQPAWKASNNAQCPKCKAPCRLPSYTEQGFT